MPDRLKELQRQRALAQEQIAWLDQEIARETGGQMPPPAVPVAPATSVTPHRPVPSPPPADAEAILAQYQNQGRSVHSEVKRGCFIYFFAAFALVVLGLIAVWFLRYRS